MKKTLLSIILMVPLWTCSARAETYGQNVLDICEYLKTVVVVSGTSLERVQEIVKKIEYKREEPDFLKLPEQLSKDGYGDCEDFTLFVLAQLKKAGFTLDEIGFASFFFSDNAIIPGHIIPIYKYEEEWYVADNWIDMNNGCVFWRLDTYIWHLQQSFYPPFPKEMHLARGLRETSPFSVFNKIKGKLEMTETEYKFIHFLSSITDDR